MWCVVVEPALSTGRNSIFETWLMNFISLGLCARSRMFWCADWFRKHTTGLGHTLVSKKAPWLSGMSRGSVFGQSKPDEAMRQCAASTSFDVCSSLSGERGQRNILSRLLLS
jgi:hypothetical protein